MNGVGFRGRECLHPVLKAQTVAAIRNQTLAFWKRELATKQAAYRKLLRGKEPGQSMAAQVDRATTAFLSTKYRCGFEHYTKQKRLSRLRSMGDVWLESSGIYHPINIKFGAAGPRGRPNIVSIGKLIRYLCEGKIDSYYLLYVKFESGERNIAPRVYFFDLLDHLQYVTFDAGPGQLMLQAALFFSAYRPSTRPRQTTTAAKLDDLLLKYREAVEQLTRNRRKTLSDHTTMIRSYRTKRTRVRAENQSDIYP